MYSENDNFNDEYEDNSTNSVSTGNKFMDFYESNKKMVLIVGGLLLVFIILLMMNSCNKDTNTDNKKVEIVLSTEKEYIAVGNSIQLEAVLKPQEAYKYPEFSWTSSKPEVASVDRRGNVTALSLGTTIITVIFDDEKDNKDPYKKTAEIHVVEGNKDVVLTKVEFPKGDELLISVGNSFKLQKKVTPSNGLIENINYTSSDEDIITVDEIGNVKALKEGTATIEMSVNNGKFTDEIDVRVVDYRVESQIITNPVEIGFDDSEITIVEGKDKKLASTCIPEGAYLDNLEWSSSDEDVATVDEEGKVTAISEGVAVITVKTHNGKKAEMTVRVEKSAINVTSIEIRSQKSLTMNINDFTDIVVDVLPANATDKTVTYESSTPSIASVDDNGRIRALSSGYATITVTTNDGNLKEYVNVTVNSSSSSGNNDGSTGGSSSNTCDANALIRIDSDSPNAITTNNGGNENTATNSIITIETDLIKNSSSCGSLKSIKWCSSASGNSCVPTTQFDVGDNLTLNVPNGTGVMYMKFEAVYGSKTLSKEYYMKYNVSGGSSSTTKTLSSFSVNVSSTTINVNGTVKINSVTANYSDGSKVDVTNSATYTSTNTSILSSTGTREFKGLKAGTAAIKITYGGKYLNKSITVAASGSSSTTKTLSSFTIDISSTTINVNGTVKINSVIANYSDGSKDDVTNSATYTSTNTSILSSSGTREFKGLQAGTADIKITYDGKSATKKITVAASGSNNPGTTTPSTGSFTANILTKKTAHGAGSSYTGMTMEMTYSSQEVSKLYYCYATNGSSCTLDYDNAQAGPNKLFAMDGFSYSYTVNNLYQTYYISINSDKFNKKFSAKPGELIVYNIVAKDGTVYSGGPKSYNFH